MNPFWIDTDRPLRLAIVPRPRGGDWLADEIDQIQRAGIEVLVSMLESEEAIELGLASESTLCQTVGLIFYSFPIPDRETPPSFASFSTFVEELRKHVRAGRSIAVHCRACIGRSSLLLAALLTQEGFTSEEAFRRLSKARGLHVPDTPEQIRWVEKFAASKEG